MSELEEALTLRPADENWTAFADPRYESINAMFGGWTAAVALRATLKTADSDAMPSAIRIDKI